MWEVIENIINKLEKRAKECDFEGNRFAERKYWEDYCAEKNKMQGLNEAIEIVKQETDKYNNGWIPCGEQLPEESGEYLTWVEYDGDRFIAIDEIDCDGIIKEWNCSTIYKVIAWQPLPHPYQPKGE